MNSLIIPNLIVYHLFDYCNSFLNALIGLGNALSLEIIYLFIRIRIIDSSRKDDYHFV